MKQIIVKKGKIFTDEVCSPSVGDKSILVDVKYSFISAGTEITGIDSSAESVAKKAIKDPNKVKKLYDLVATTGIKATYNTIKAKSKKGDASGYSLSGIVIDIGKKIKKFKVGDQVACAGANYAVHAEIAAIPENLAVKIPAGCPMEEASGVAIGSIAMQGVRRANVQLGENVAVIGLGLIGQITAQLLISCGCKVIGIDIDEKRIKQCLNNGLDHGIDSLNENLIDEINCITNDLGVDATIICASSNSSNIVQQAMQITRKRGRVVVVGSVGMELKRKPFYEKEIDFLISCSYGPGRYDNKYEIEGIGYPKAYVRWSENDNMSSYLDLIARKKLNVGYIIEEKYPIEKAYLAYQSLKENKPLGILIEYKEQSENNKIQHTIQIGNSKNKEKNKIKVAVVGTGSFATSVHLPNIQKLNHLYELHSIVGKNGNSLQNIAEIFKPQYISTNYQEAINDKDVGLVIICTRHNLHAEMAIKALNAGKAVLLEKPLALNNNELDEVIKAIEKSDQLFTVGYNRRFAPASIKAKQIINNKGPMVVLYRVKANPVPPQHWVQTHEGGGRILGEACHMLDWFNFITSSSIVEIGTGSIGTGNSNLLMSDNFSANIKYENGSLCNLIYTTQGSIDTGKEYIEIFYGKNTLIIDDFKKLYVPNMKNNLWESKISNKGHLNELEKIAVSIKEGKTPPISFKDLIETSKATLIIDEMIRK